MLVTWISACSRRPGRSQSQRECYSDAEVAVPRLLKRAGAGQRRMPDGQPSLVGNLPAGSGPDFWPYFSRLTFLAAPLFMRLLWTTSQAHVAVLDCVVTTSMPRWRNW